jgi:hypothetical protein
VPHWMQFSPVGVYDGLSAKRGAAERASGPIATPR